ncbi:MAG: DUF1315 family protein [Pseudomonadales bacterium]|nr:DUF1315 family protein [Pseudomonadales bacterium]
MEELLHQLTPEVYASIKTAIELGKWADGNKLTQDQLENSMQLLILYEARELPESARTGKKLNTCESGDAETVVLNLQSKGSREQS